MKDSGLYRVREGFTVKLAGSPQVIAGGKLVEMTPDQAKLHGHKLEEPSKEHVAAYRAERAAEQKRASDADSAADRRRREENEATANALMQQAAALRQAA